MKMTPRQIEQASNRLNKLRQQATAAFFASDMGKHRRLSQMADALAHEIAAGYRTSKYWSADIRDQLIASLSLTRG